MPRLARKLLNGEFFHITVKGINGEYIFQDDKNKNEYLKLLKEKINIDILAYCIMDNLSSFNDYFGINHRNLINNENIFKLFNNKDINDNLKKFKEYHLKDSLIEYEFDEEINYKEMIKAYQQIYSNKEIEKQLVYKFKLPIKKIAKLMNTSFYFIKKDIEN